MSYHHRRRSRNALRAKSSFSRPLVGKRGLRGSSYPEPWKRRIKLVARAVIELVTSYTPYHLFTLAQWCNVVAYQEADIGVKQHRHKLISGVT